MKGASGKSFKVLKPWLTARQKKKVFSAQKLSNIMAKIKN